jgi:signal peptidase I
LEETSGKKDAAARHSPLRIIWTVFKEYFFLIPVVLITIFLFHTVFFLGIIPSASMEPTLDIGAGVFAVKTSPSSLQRGDVIVFHPPVKGSEKQVWIKRVIGLPGDTVHVKHHEVYVNGNLLNEPYVNGTADYENATYKIPKGSVFVMGDNRNESLDARFWKVHALAEKNIIGKVRLHFMLSRSCRSGIGLMKNTLTMQGQK